MPNIAEYTIFEAVKENSLKRLGNILDLDDDSFDINARNASGLTALMEAARVGSAVIARALLNRTTGIIADITLVSDGTGKTAAQIAESAGFIALKTAILTNVPSSWLAAIQECDDFERRIDDSYSRPRP